MASRQEEPEEYGEEYYSEIESGVVKFFETITIIGLVMIALFIFASFLMTPDL